MHHDLEIVLNNVRGSFVAPGSLRRNLLGSMVTGLEIDPVTLNLRLRLCAAENLPSGGFYEPFREAASLIGKDVEGVVAGSFFLTHADIAKLVDLAASSIDILVPTKRSIIDLGSTVGYETQESCAARIRDSQELIARVRRFCGKNQNNAEVSLEK